MLLVLELNGLRLRHNGGALLYHEGMARLRWLRLRAGGRDPLVDIAEVRAGDRVLDCTMGLAQDAPVLARSVGQAGLVVALEASLVIHAVVADGLARLTCADRAG